LSDTFRQNFSPELPFGRFCWNVSLLSGASILPFLLVYVITTPNFLTMLATNTTALGRFLRQVLTNGLPVVFLVNYLGFVFAYAALKNSDRPGIRYIILDGLLRGIAFVGIHILVYVLSADLFGSFGGNRATAISVVGPTLVWSFIFDNISGVYLYALAPGAFIALLAVLSHPGSRTPKVAQAKVYPVALLASLIPVPVVTALSFALNFVA
jgi:hypothetical protein